ncbi:universal stress protein [Glycocaulis profundi]|nr:universal stress protein [Glycocaulis profundi]
MVQKAARDDVCRWLARHGVRSEVRSDPDVRGPAGPHSRHVNEESEAGLIVCGAYGRSRMREFIFGGVTRELLMNAAVPCLTAH